MANRRRKIYKKRSIKKVDQKQVLYDQVLKEVQKANARLDSLYRRYKKGTWASKKLINRLDTSTIKAWNKQRGKIKINKNLTSTQLKAVQKAVNQFMVSKTSTKKGIKSVSMTTKESLKKTLADDQFNNITDEDIDFYYSMLSDYDFNYFSDKIGASTLWIIIDDAIESNDSEDNFISRLEQYINFSNDLDIIDGARNLYNKYVI